ncbi:MAG TPA: hypothetical protein VFR19_21115 [Hyphomicrobiaceae bacterium]|jgi:hypothetical protein|nr:hypothetical protein [Hyphomicrobiaceae bacterium]
MRCHSIFASLAAALAVLGIGASSAAARCTTLAFSVNDYGKDGPTKDAKDLLDKYIAKWTKDNNVATYTVGKKDVSCELFLNFIVFDEHTCKASALVCWPGEGGPPAAAAPAAAKPPVAKPAAKKSAG